LTLTRLIDVACEVAQNSPNWQPPFPATLIVRFESERQKFTSAVQSPGPKHWL
jgi:hypothetical protein